MSVNPCSYPKKCWYPKPEHLNEYVIDGKKPKLIFNRKKATEQHHELKIPCRKCPNCLYNSASSWGVRAACEMQMHEQNTYVTLTYAVQPKFGNLIPKDFLNFIRRLKAYFPNNTVRYLYSGERGGKLGRPHFHAIIFGLNFPDLIQMRNSATDAPMWHSQILTDIWGHGITTVGEANITTAAYVAQYVVKKIAESYDGSTNKTRESEIVDPISGELITYTRQGDYIGMSRMPGIGHSYFVKNQKDIFPSCELIIKKGEQYQRVAIPQYFYKLLEKYNPELYTKVKASQLKKGLAHQLAHPDESSPERLLQQATCAASNREKLSRKLDADTTDVNPEQQFLKALKIKQDIDKRKQLLIDCNINISRLHDDRVLQNKDYNLEQLLTPESLSEIELPDFYELRRFKQLQIKLDLVRKLQAKIESKRKIIYRKILRTFLSPDNNN